MTRSVLITHMVESNKIQFFWKKITKWRKGRKKRNKGREERKESYFLWAVHCTFIIVVVVIITIIIQIILSVSWWLNLSLAIKCYFLNFIPSLPQSMFYENLKLQNNQITAFCIYSHYSSFYFHDSSCLKFWIWFSASIIDIFLSSVNPTFIIWMGQL
jgi:hypothetical protein